MLKTDSVCHKTERQIKQTFRVTLSLKHSGGFSLVKTLFKSGSCVLIYSCSDLCALPMNYLKSAQ